MKAPRFKVKKKKLKRICVHPLQSVSRKPGDTLTKHLDVDANKPELLMMAGGRCEEDIRYTVIAETQSAVNKSWEVPGTLSPRKGEYPSVWLSVCGLNTLKPCRR